MWDSHAFFLSDCRFGRKVASFLIKNFANEGNSIKDAEAVNEVHALIHKEKSGLWQIKSKCSWMPCILTALHWLLYGIVKKRISSISLTYSKKSFNNLYAIFSHSHLHCGMKAFIEYKSVRWGRYAESKLLHTRHKLKINLMQRGWIVRLLRKEQLTQLKRHRFMNSKWCNLRSERTTKIIGEMSNPEYAW